MSVIAPYSSDVDNRVSGEIYARSTTTDTVSINKIKDLVKTHFSDYSCSDFVATNVIIVTWENVGYYNQQSNKVHHVVICVIITSIKRVQVCILSDTLS